MEEEAMAAQAPDEMVADLMLGTVMTLKAICNHLIDKSVLNRELLLADLVSVQADLPREVSLAAAVPAALYAELGGRPITQSQ
jgi:hypothetical protein